MERPQRLPAPFGLPAAATAGNSGLPYRHWQGQIATNQTAGLWRTLSAPTRQNAHSGPPWTAKPPLDWLHGLQAAAACRRSGQFHRLHQSRRRRWSGHAHDRRPRRRARRSLPAGRDRRRRAERAGHHRWGERHASTTGGHHGRRAGLQPVPPPPGLPGTSHDHRTFAGDAVVPADQGGAVMRADLLAGTIAGLDDALATVDAFDRILVAGLLRPQPAQAVGLTQLARALAGTPLASRVAEAAEKAAAGPASEEIVTAPGGQQAANLLAAGRSWLSDLARSGWRGLDNDVVSGSAQVVSAMLPDPALRRLATLLDGFAAELAASCPGAALERVPARRWADLWSRAMLLTLPGAADTPVTGTVTGRLLPLGVDLQEHATAVQAQVHAVFEPADGTVSRLVRASVSAPKPDTVVGAGVWQLLRPHMSLLAAVSEGRSMDLADMPVTAEGDLIWIDEHARPGQPADPFATARVALPTAADAAAVPLDRHPARIAVPVFLEGYAARKDDDALTFTVAGHPLAVDTDRIPAAGPLTPEAVAASGACIGLLRWDAGSFSVQPLAVETTVRKQAVAVHAGGWAGGTTGQAGVKAEKAATDAMSVLRERAGRLLRK